MALNKVMLIGNVGQDPEIRYLDSNPQQEQPTKVAQFSLATTDRWTERNGQPKEVTTWHRLVAWRSLADIVEKYVHRGDQIYVEGKLTTRQWQDQQGNTHTATEIQVTNIQLLGKKTAETRQDTPAPAPATPAPARKRQEQAESLDPREHEDLPF